MSRQTIAESILGAIEWEDETLGYCACPGEALHTHPTGKLHCRVALSGAPTIHCFHSSCSSAVEEANHRLRSEIGREERGGVANPQPYVPTPEDQEKLKQKREMENLKGRAVESLAFILKKYALAPADLWEESPIRLLDDPEDDWRRLLHLFDEKDVVWIGDKFSSCSDDADEQRKASYRGFFRTREDWLKLKVAPGNFTCPSTFQPGTYSRSNKNVVVRRFHVIESDCLSKEDMLAVINWCHQFMRLRAVVDTAGKSLHGWFDAVAPEVEAKLKVILPNLGRESDEQEKTLDPALFKLAQPCRLPGARRDGKLQTLLYLDLA
jgi:hypothetical protein